MIDFGQQLGEQILNSKINLVELIGDVGSGKTTITKGIAKALSVSEAVTSPSFTIAKRYPGKSHILAHYDFYRLPDPGLMSEDLFESISDPKTITVVEWAESVSDVLPEKHLSVKITLNEDGSRSVTVSGDKK